MPQPVAHLDLTPEVNFDFFFDRPAVNSVLTRAQKRYLGRVGGYARRAIRSSIKKKGLTRKAPKKVGGKAHTRWLQEVDEKPPSTPPDAPHTHSGWYRDAWAYALDPTAKAVVIGGRWARSRHIIDRHELGEQVSLKEYEQQETGRTILRESPPWNVKFEPTGKTVMASYRQRSAIEPGREKTEPKMAEFYAQALHAQL